LNIKIAIVLGTRPEIIKLAPIIREIQRQNLDYYIIHSGQHYSYNMDKIFFDQLHLPRPKYKLEVGSGRPGEQTSKIISGVERVITQDKPNIVLVQGDTNTVVGGALAAKKSGVKLGHIEAGLRSYDERMPEELNRILTDHASDFLFAPTEKSKRILLSEGILKKKIFVTGNTVVDSVNQNWGFAEKKFKVLDKLKIETKRYFLVSLHRQENVDNPKTFKNIINGLKLIRRKNEFPIIYPIHPRAKLMARKFKIDFGDIRIIEPQDYLTFLFLQKNAKLIMTDSGGVQEEACILKIPCVTLRENTERPETVEVGANKIAGTDQRRIVASVRTMMDKKNSWRNPFGNGKSSEKIIDILLQNI
jgi:UDP-N-acetylglucosamine 2-epimerase (non-hydrolysing)